MSDINLETNNVIEEKHGHETPPIPPQYDIDSVNSRDTFSQEFLNLSLRAKVVFILPIAIIAFSIFVYVFNKELVPSIVTWLSKNGYYVIKELSSWLFMVFFISTILEKARIQEILKGVIVSQDRFMNKVKAYLDSLNMKGMQKQTQQAFIDMKEELEALRLKNSGMGAVILKDNKKVIAELNEKIEKTEGIALEIQEKVKVVESALDDLREESQKFKEATIQS